jgi:hypothetical protein
MFFYHLLFRMNTHAYYGLCVRSKDSRSAEFEKSRTENRTIAGQFITKTGKKAKYSMIKTLRDISDYKVLYRKKLTLNKRQDRISHHYLIAEYYIGITM